LEKVRVKVFGAGSIDVSISSFSTRKEVLSFIAEDLLKRGFQSIGIKKGRRPKPKAVTEK